MLNLVIGRSGSGKTEYVKNLLCSFSEKEDAKLMMIVPEQLSFETEKDFLNILGPVKSRNIQVLSFSRMVDFAFRQTGGLSGNAVTDGGRSIIMSLALEQCMDKLELYGKQAHKMELVSIMLTAVKEYKMCCISTQLLRETALKTDNETLRKKLNETALITDVYNALLEKSYIDPLDDLTRLAGILRENNLFKDYTVVVDAFSGYTVQEQQILQEIFKQAENVYVTICTDKEERANLSRRFNTTNTTKKQLTVIAKRAGIKVSAPIYLEDNHRMSSPDLKALEEEIYKQTGNTYKGEVKNVTVYHACDIYGECDYVASAIKKLTVDENYRYKDIAVITRDLEAYRGVLDTAFDKYGIGYFMDKPQNIESKPLISFVYSALDIASRGFNTESILRLLKTGVVNVTDEETAALENYAFTWSINGKRWTKEFTANPSGYSDKFTDEDKSLLTEIERIRSSIITPLEKFRSNIKETDGKTISLYLYKLLEQFKVEENLKKQISDFIANGEIEKGKEVLRVWDMLMDILDQTALILKEHYITPKRYSELLKAIVMSQDISFIPKGLDQVTVGAADRVRLKEPRAVFVIGAIEGEFPSLPVSAGVFSDVERKNLIALNLPMYDSIEDLSSLELFHAYTSISSTKEKLFVSCYESDLNGESKSASSIITEIMNILPNVSVQYEKEQNPYDNLWSEKRAFELTAQKWQSGEENENLLKEYFKNIPSYKDKIKVLELYTRDDKAEIKDKALAEKLFGKTMNLSASQVEKFYLCKFQYFCRYGIKAKERKKAEMDSAQYGSLIHYILEEILKGYSIEELSKLSQTDIRNIAENEMNNYLNSHLGGEEDKSMRYMVSYKRSADAVVTVIIHIIKELCQSSFSPIDFELKIGQDIKAYELNTDKGSLIIRGAVDRVDIYRENNTAFIRIVDYKTGNKKFVLSDIAFGLNLQMLIYLSAIVKNGESRYKLPVAPAGVLYMPSAENMVTADDSSDLSEIEAQRNKKYKMNGLILNDPDIIQAMEKDGKGVYIPVSLKEEKVKSKDKESRDLPPSYVISRGQEYAVSVSEMHRIFDKIDILLKNMTDNLLDGKISAVPAKGTYDACKWCPYVNICTYKDGKECREIVKVKDGKALLEKEVQ